MLRLIMRPRIALTFVIGAGAIAAVLAFRPACTEVGPDELSRLSVADLANGQARSFCYRDSVGEKIRFILARGSDGKIRAVFDACHQCYTFHKGYKVSDGALVCRFCGNRYAIDHMMAGKASCVPVKLPHQEHDGVVQVKADDLRAGRKLF